MRRRGTGSIHHVGAGWRWYIRVEGVARHGRSRRTRAEAVAELDRMIADPTFVPEAPRTNHERAEMGNNVKRAAALAKAAKRKFKPVEDGIPVYTDAQVEAAERKVRRWGKRGADGKRRCLPCGGTGVDSRPGPGAGNACLACWGGEDG